LYLEHRQTHIDAHFAKIVRTIEKYGIQRLVIDGMTSYSAALVDQAVYRDFFHSLAAFSKNRLMTTFFNYENPEFPGLSSFMRDSRTVSATVLPLPLLRRASAVFCSPCLCADALFCVKAANPVGFAPMIHLLPNRLPQRSDFLGGFSARIEFCNGAACCHCPCKGAAVCDRDWRNRQSIAFQHRASLGDLRGTERTGGKNKHRPRGGGLHDFDGGSDCGEIERGRAARNDHEVCRTCHTRRVRSSTGAVSMVQSVMAS
jgi:hypothetical protein